MSKNTSTGPFYMGIKQYFEIFLTTKILPEREKINNLLRLQKVSMRLIQIHVFIYNMALLNQNVSIYLIFCEFLYLSKELQNTCLRIVHSQQLWWILLNLTEAAML